MRILLASEPGSPYPWTHIGPQDCWTAWLEITSGQVDGNCQSAMDHKCEVELGRTILEARARELRREARKQACQRAFLREERKTATKAEGSIDSDNKALKHRLRESWFPEEHLTHASMPRLRLNVGGEIFELSKKLLVSDPDSLLAALNSIDCPLFTSNGFDRAKIAYIDRDWWIFRYVLIFLRDGILPKNHIVVMNLYKEAEFWRLSSLRRAIEEIHLNVFRNCDSVGDLVKRVDTNFWITRPNWWESQPSASKNESKGRSDWWLGEDWRGVRLGPLSTHPEKVLATKDDVKVDANVYAMMSSTWSYT